MTPHFPHHLVIGVVALAATFVVSRLTVNRLVRRKLRVAFFLFGAYTLLHVVLVIKPDLFSDTRSLTSFERLGLTAGLINLFVVCLINPLRADRVPDRFPSIVQDAIVIALLILIATFAFGDQFLATSAVSAVVIGLALQDTLGNAFAGLAIQSEKPFNVGHWVAVGEHEGRVAEVTWRATKLRTKSGNFVIVPNSEVAKAPITNYSEPAAPTRLFVDVGVSYEAPPNRVKAVMREALGNCPLVLIAPPCDVVFMGFGDFTLNFRVRFWIEDFEQDEIARDQVRTALYYALQRRGIEIPYPIQVEMHKEWRPPDDASRIAERMRLIAGVDLLAGLDEPHRRLLAASTSSLTFADGEAIVREGDRGESMFIVCAGEVVVSIAASRDPIAVIPTGGYFGEMSVLTGDPRTAKVSARGDVVVLEVPAEAFRQLAEVDRHAVEKIGVAAATRSIELTEARASATSAAAVAEAPATFLSRMRRFLSIR